VYHSNHNPNHKKSLSAEAISAGGSVPHPPPEMKKNILVTGSHRSGSTWTGRVLAKAKEIVYIQEPFNLSKNKERKTPLKYWFELVSDQDPKERQVQFKNYLDQELCNTWQSYLKSTLNAKGIKSAYQIARSYRQRFLTKRKLVKDPVALFSAEWISDNYDMDVLILIRHPAAFADSLRRAGWSHNFAHFSEQGKPMQDAIAPFREDIQKFMESPERQEDLIEHAVLLWNIIYTRVAAYKKMRKDWLFVKHEDLSMNPLNEFQKIFDAFQIPFNGEVKQFLQHTTQAKEASKIKRNSRENVQKWKDNLTSKEIDRIYNATQSVSSQFYTDQEW
jgi:hypothetical protein